jgi:hypothetical protein
MYLKKKQRYNVDWVLLPKKTVYWAVRTESLFILQVRLNLQCHAMALAVSLRPPWAEPQARSQVNPCRWQNGTTTSFPQILRVFKYSLVNTFPPMQHNYFGVALIWEPSKSNALSVIRGHWIESTFYIRVSSVDIWNSALLASESLDYDTHTKICLKSSTSY